jgi:hypothetical protein
VHQIGVIRIHETGKKHILELEEYKNRREYEVSGVVSLQMIIMSRTLGESEPRTEPSAQLPDACPCFVALRRVRGIKFSDQTAADQGQNSGLVVSACWYAKRPWAWAVHRGGSGDRERLDSSVKKWQAASQDKVSLYQVLQALEYSCCTD